MINREKLANDIFSLLKGYNYKIKLFGEVGDETVDPSVATRFYVIDPSVMVTIMDDSVVLNKGADISLEDSERLQHSLRRLANKNLLNFTVKQYGKTIQPRDFSYQAKINKGQEMQKVTEASLSKLSGSAKTSKQQLENVKILVKHKTPVQEEKHGARSRNIHSIFLERNGERFRFPNNCLGAARAMARHMYNEGSFTDSVGQYIIEKSAQSARLKEFYRYAKNNKLVNETSNDIVELVKENYNTIQEEMKRLAGSNTYSSVKDKIELSENTTLNEENDDLSNLRDMFTVKRFDEKYEEILPLVNKLLAEKNSRLNRIEESSKNPVYITKLAFMEDEVVEYGSASVKFGHKCVELASRIVENNELANFLESVGQKLCTEQKISDFEKSITQSVLGNIKLQEEKPQTISSEITEAKLYEQFLNKYLYKI